MSDKSHSSTAARVARIEAFFLASLVLFPLVPMINFIEWYFGNKTYNFITPFIKAPIYKYTAGGFAFIFLILHIIRLNIGLMFSTKDTSLNEVKSSPKYIRQEPIRVGIDVAIYVSVIVFLYLFYNRSYTTILVGLFAQAILLIFWHIYNYGPLKDDAQNPNGDSDKHQIVMIQVGDIVFILYSVMALLFYIFNEKEVGSDNVRKWICEHTCIFLIAAFSISLVHLIIETICVYRDGVAKSYRQIRDLILSKRASTETEG